MHLDAHRRGTMAAPIGDAVAESAMLRATLDVQREMICAWTPDGTVQFCNLEYREFFGYGPTVLGTNLADLVEWSAGESVGSQVQSIVDAGDVLVTQRRYHDGRSVEWTDSGVRGADGSLTTIVSVGRDVTSALQVEGALRQSQTRLRVILRHISDAVVLLDRDLSVIESSPHHRSFLGYPPGAWRGEDPLQVVHPDDRSTAVRVLRALLRSAPDGEARGEVRLLRADGSYTMVEMSGANLLDEVDVRALVLVLRGIDERKAAEQAALQRQQVLEKELRQRTSFVEEASHALRNPLHGMLGLSELLTKAELDLPLADAAWAIFRQASTMRRIVDDMLDHALLEVGHLRVEVADVDLQYVVNDCARLARLGVADEARLVTPDVPAPWRTVRGDPDRVRQVLANLLANACAATPSGTITVVVTEGEAPGTTRCSVMDDGSGVDAGDIARLFLPYERGDAADRSGVGLGLAIAKGAVEAMGGTIGAAARPSGGAVFWFELPAVAASTPRTPGSPGGEAVERDSLRVLVVDDDPVNLMLAGMQVERMGGVVTSVPSGMAALDALGVEQFDVALIDVQMPEMDGLELVRRITSAAAPRPLLAVMTASATAADRTAALEAGADLFVPKPATLDDVRKVLDARRGRAIALR